MKKIGTVEILVPRIYPLDMAATAHNQSGVMSEVAVQPDVYDLFDDHGVRFWMMKGNLVQNIAFRIGEGTFSMSEIPSDVEVTFPSDRYDERMWSELLTTPLTQEGNPAQRLRIAIEETASV